MPEFKINELVWAKMKGYPPWPARIIEPIGEVKLTKCKEIRYCVRFFGARSQTAFVVASDILSFEEGKKKCSQKKIAGTYKDAVEEMFSFAPPSKNTDEKPLLSCKIEQVKVESPKKNLANVSSAVTLTNNSVKKSPHKYTQTSPKNNQKSPLTKERKSPVKRSLTASVKKPINFEQKKRIKRELNKTNSNCKEENHIPEPFAILKTVKAEETMNEAFTPVNSSSEIQDVTSCEPLTLTQDSAVLENISLPSFDSKANDDDIALSSTKIGFIGLGSMGSIILTHLINSETKRCITIWNRTISKCDKFKEAGVVVADNPADVMTKSDIVFSCVSDHVAVKDIVYNEDGILSTLSLGKGYVDMTTIDPDFSQSISTAVTKRNGRFLEVSILGMKKDALNATLLLLAAGDRPLFDACHDCFKDIAEHVIFLGDVGTASRMNLIVNIVKATCFTSISEAMNLAEYAGISQKDTVAILEQGLLNCPAIIDHGNAILDMVNGTEPESESDNMPIEHMQRTLRLALNIADRHAQPLPTTAAVNDLYTLMKRQDQDRGKRSDIIEIYKVLAGNDDVS